MKGLPLALIALLMAAAPCHADNAQNVEACRRMIQDMGEVGYKSLLNVKQVVLVTDMESNMLRPVMQKTADAIGLSIEAKKSPVRPPQLTVLTAYSPTFGYAGSLSIAQYVRTESAPNRLIFSQTYRIEVRGPIESREQVIDMLLEQFAYDYKKAQEAPVDVQKGREI